MVLRAESADPSCYQYGTIYAQVPHPTGSEWLVRSLVGPSDPNSTRTLAARGCSLRVLQILAALARRMASHPLFNTTLDGSLGAAEERRT